MEQLDSIASGIEIFGNYILLEKFAMGGMAEVFLARPAVREGNGRLLVIKRILPHVANQHEFLNMFQREIQISMGFTHPHVVQLYDFGSVNGQPYIAMEYIEGKSLHDVSVRLKMTGGALPIPVALSLVAQTASGLHYAHTFRHKTDGTPLNAIHRDISPHNLLVSFDGNLKVIDFGIAKAACCVPNLSRTGTIKGKVGYLSPEQLEGKELDARSDIFSLGVVAWELLTGHKLFAKPGDTEGSILKKVYQSDKYVVPPSVVRQLIPADLDRLILKALEKDRNKRFGDAREFQLELRKHLLKHYPDHTYANTGEVIRALFDEDLARRRQHTKEINQCAQEMLDGSADEDTAVLNPGNGVEGVVARRLSLIESALKQKASMRHYLLLAFYIVTIIALKFGDLRYILMDHFATRGHATVTSVSPSRSLAKTAGRARQWPNRYRKAR